jgi:hypothetical protein
VEVVAAEFAAKKNLNRFVFDFRNQNGLGFACCTVTILEGRMIIKMNLSDKRQEAT